MYIDHIFVNKMNKNFIYLFVVPSMYIKRPGTTLVQGVNTAEMIVFNVGASIHVSCECAWLQ